LSGKKQDKTRITLALATSASGEKYPPFFIGRSKMPRCFKKKDPKELDLHYMHNKNAWMTREFFEL